MKGDEILFVAGQGIVEAKGHRVTCLRKNLE
jgi:hypothetical protein